MQISVILPCFNGAKTIAVQLDALARQQWSGTWEVVVVNNGSTDESMTIVETYRDRLPNLRIVDAHHPPEPRQGVGHSYRVGFAAAKGDAFLLCEADDEVGDGWLPAMAEALKQHQFVAAAIDYTRLNPPELGRLALLQTREMGLPTVAKRPLFLPWASGCALGLQRSVYMKVGDPADDCAVCWDIDYCWRVQLAGFPLTFVPDATVHYRLRHDPKSRFRQARSWGDGQTLLQLKFGPRVSVKTIARHLASSCRRFARLALRLGSVLSGRETMTHWVWELGWCIGFLQGTRHLLRAARTGRPDNSMGKQAHA